MISNNSLSFLSVKTMLTEYGATKTVIAIQRLYNRDVIEEALAKELIAKVNEQSHTTYRLK